MAKLCPRGKAAAKRKFKVYPSAYANMYASAVCSGKVTPGGKKKNRKKAGGLREWVKQNWVDIANKRKDGSYPKCGRSGGEKRKNYPKCVPIAKARAMSKGQRAGAVRRKQAKANTGPTPSRAATFAKKKKTA
jgi:hypothetical protein